jgi:uncharacterized phage-associated protein
MADEESDVLSESVKKHIESILFTYSGYSPAKLVKMTHNEAPWREADPGGEISHKAMRIFFSGRLKQVSV